MSNRYFFHIVLGFVTASICFQPLIANATSPLESHSLSEAEEDSDNDNTGNDTSSSSITTIKLLAGTGLIAVIGGVVYCWPGNDQAPNKFEKTPDKVFKNTQPQTPQDSTSAAIPSQNTNPSPVPPAKTPNQSEGQDGEPASRPPELQDQVKQTFDQFNQNITELQQQADKMRRQIERVQQPLTESSVDDNRLHPTQETKDPPPITVNGTFSSFEAVGATMYYIQSKSEICPKHGYVKYILSQRRIDIEGDVEPWNAIWFKNIFSANGNIVSLSKKQYYKSRSIPENQLNDNVKITLTPINQSQYMELRQALITYNHAH